jgi:CheY-like chemotaxis protein
MTVLFIDDDPEDTALFCEAIEYLNNSKYLNRQREKAICITLNDPCHEIDKLDQLKDKLNLIFLDINMPVMSGKECLEYLKSHPRFRSVPVIMLSTTCEAPDEFIKMGARDCIQKPAGFNQLVKLLSKYIYE